jgi:hypothetical protein
MIRAVWRFLTSLTTCAWVGLSFCAAEAAGPVVANGFLLVTGRGGDA